MFSRENRNLSRLERAEEQPVLEGHLVNVVE